MTISELEKIYTDRLSGLYELEEAKNLCYFAVEHISQLTKPQIMLSKNLNLSLKDEASLTMVLDELQTGKPIQYIIGESQFFGFGFKVNPSVLVPRPETEELVAWILKEVKGRGGKRLNILDIGTGSGCIPVVLKKKLPDADVFAIDNSDSAIETAMKNAVLNEAEIKFFNDDILAPKLNYQPLTFDVVVSNPPYITESEQEQMHRNVLKFEPHNALFVPDDNPLLFFKAIVDFAICYLKEGGLLFFEINEQFGKHLVSLLGSKNFRDIELRKDLMGKDRMIKAVK